MAVSLKDCSEAYRAYASSKYLQHILGIEASIWTESVDSDTKLDDGVFPRLIAVAENGWIPDGQKNYQDFLKRLNDNLKCPGHMGIEYGSLEK